MMEAINSSETSIPTRGIRHHIPEDGILHSHSENLKFYTDKTTAQNSSTNYTSWLSTFVETAWRKIKPVRLKQHLSRFAYCVRFEVFTAVTMNRRHHSSGLFTIPQPRMVGRDTWKCRIFINITLSSSVRWRYAMNWWSLESEIRTERNYDHLQTLCMQYCTSARTNMTTVRNLEASSTNCMYTESAPHYKDLHKLKIKWNKKRTFIRKSATWTFSASFSFPDKYAGFTH
jgi:hypothetical protein